VITELEHRVRLAIQTILPEDLVVAVRKIEAYLGWGDTLVVHLHTRAPRRIEPFRNELRSAIASATAEARILLYITDGPAILHRL